MYVVSGCPRSGTSLMMEIFRTSLGDERIIGQKFPVEERVSQRKDEAVPIFAYRKYVQALNQNRKPESFRDMNPDGFWECPFTVEGVAYRPPVRDLIKRVGTEEKPSVCKVVSQGLFQSNPVYIDSVVYMLRGPEAVAKSQEKLRRNFTVKHPSTRNPVNLFDGLIVQSPQMFIEVTLKAAQWFSENLNIPLYIVKFDELIAHPKKVLRKLSRAVGENLVLGAKCVRTELDRSSGMTITHPLMEEALQVYAWFMDRNWKALRQYQVDRTTQQNRQQQQWFCARSASMAQESICRSCTQDSVFCKQLRVDAETRGWDWKIHPCAFECAYDTERQHYVPLDESIQNNHWKEVG